MRSARGIINYLIIGFCVLASGLATKLFRDVEVLLVLCFISLIYLTIKGRLLNKRYLLACMVWLLYVILAFLKVQSGNPLWSFSIFCGLTISYALIDRFGYDLGSKYCDVIYVFALWSLVLLSWQLISLDSMIYVWSAFDMSDKLYDKPYTYYMHTFFYTIHQFIDVSKGAVRNSGFCWEPGAFACFLVLAIYIQILRDSYRVSSNKLRYAVLFLALLSTQSTTGLAGLAVIIISYLMNVQGGNKYKYGLFLLLALIPIGFMVSSQVDKIEMQASADVFDEVYLKDSSEHEKGLGRFQSIVILSMDFAENPILGVGSDRSQTWVSKMGLSANPTSGVGNMFATYGLFIMVPYLYLLRKSSSSLSQHYGVRGGWELFAIFLIIGFSFSVLETPVFFSMALLWLFARKKRSLEY